MTTDDFLRRQIIPIAYRQLPAAELFARAARGDAEAFVALVCVKYPQVEGVCRQVAGPGAAVEDVALETFVQLWRQRCRVRDAAAVDGWLTRTARNLARRSIRDHARGRAAGRAWWHRTGEAATPMPPDRAAIHAEMIRRIRLAMSEQSDADQQILWVAESAGGDARAAEALGVSVSAYRVRLHRARQRLRALLKKYGITPAAGAISLLSGMRRRAAAAIVARWATSAGRVQVIGVAVATLAGLFAAALWVSRPAGADPEPESPPRAIAHAPAADPSPIESLQEQNIRIVRDDIVPKLRDLAQRFYPPDNTVRVADVRAFGSEVEVEFQPTHPPPPGREVPARLRTRYCCHRRQYVVQVQLPGTDRWYTVNPTMPKIISMRVPLGWDVEITFGQSEFQAAEKLFDRLPPDSRAEEEQIRFLFGPPGGELRLPAGANGFAVDAGRMFLVDAGFGLYIRERTGRWRYDSPCPGWWLVARGGRLYCTRGDEILTRPVDSPGSPWVRWGDFPAIRPGEKGGFLAIAGDRLHVAIYPYVFCHRPLADASAPWIQEVSSQRVWPDGIAATPDRLFGHDNKDLLTRPVHDASAPWTALARWPEGAIFLAVDGDRLLAAGREGPIHARPVNAGPDVEWQVIGTVRDPRPR